MKRTLYQETIFGSSVEIKPNEEDSLNEESDETINHKYDPDMYVQLDLLSL